jgi:hypothetical protein
LISRDAFLLPAPGIDITDPILNNPSPSFAPYLTELRLGGGAGSNAGYLAIDGGGANVAVRDCFANGSSSPLEPIEPTETGIAAGPALQGFQERFEDAAVRGCMTWQEIRDSIIASRLNPGEGWYCSPLVNQDTAVVLIPITEEDFTDTQGLTVVNVDDNQFGPEAPYLLAFFWIDRDLTFDMTGNNWKYLDTGGGGGPGGGQGQAVISGTFIIEHPTTLGAAPGSGSGGLVDCNPSLDSTLQCFVQLVE